MKTNFSRDEIEWIDSIEIDSRRKVLTSEAVENPKASLLRAGVIKETPKGLVVATEYKDMFHVKQLPRKPKPKPEPKPEPKKGATLPVAKNPRPQGFGKIGEKITFPESCLVNVMDAFHLLPFRDGTPTNFGGFMASANAGVASRDTKDAMRYGDEMRAVFDAIIADDKARRRSQLYVVAISTASDPHIRLTKLAWPEAKRFSGVRVQLSNNLKAAAFSGPMDAVVGAVVMYTYNAYIADRHALRVLRDAQVRGKDTGHVYDDALTEAMAWLG